ncbi:hypothetical protein ACFY9F_23045 [Streptomyces sp. NPDC012421]|uniref:hypothetical protein n=1 Tax=Streptomyces sp. NPDC012421 TaxID=3364832 RepID=UPI0036E39E52
MLRAARTARAARSFAVAAALCAAVVSPVINGSGDDHTGHHVSATDGSISWDTAPHASDDSISWDTAPHGSGDSISWDTAPHASGDSISWD